MAYSLLKYKQLSKLKEVPCKLPSASCSIDLSCKWNHVPLSACVQNYQQKTNIKDDEINRTDLSSHLKINGDINFSRLTATTITEIEF